MHIYFTLAILLLSQARSEPIDLTVANFTTAVDLTTHKVTSEGQTWFILFYAPWCGWCKHLMPTWQILSNLAHSADSSDAHLNVARVDCTQNRRICKHFEVKEYPTLLFFVEDQVYLYTASGGRDLEDLETYALNQGYLSSKRSKQLKLKEWKTGWQYFLSLVDDEI